ncbi:hypothetical protein GOP47_0018960 [Adiantum capillus-veneris]|uniref:Thylakoid lumenal 15 kDa protein 1, chloroplastic n=1 Tax=Adiantum capillus-veneris TaxID=13818 RepID=A0A9D4UE81_ADICA|nr:hypothetical protein GOP47_0018960 [Adiantum capillus-veneris]
MASLALASAAAVVVGSRFSSRPAFCVRAASQESNKQACQKPDAGLLFSKLELHTKSMQHLGRAALIAAAAAALMFTDPALAFKGGGPYGQEVTRGLDLSGKDFSGKTLIKQDFKASNLRQTNFKGAKLLGASFFDANLTGSDLTDADLRGADLSLTNAAKANFTNANLEGALVTGNTSFKGAIITGADFTDVLFRDDQRNYLCSVADGVNSVTGNSTRDTLGC